MSDASRREFLWASAVLWLAACAPKSGPPWAPDPGVRRQAEEQLEEHHWHTVALLLTDGQRIEGKLIAVDERGLTLLIPGQSDLVSFAFEDIAGLQYRGVDAGKETLDQVQSVLLGILGTVAAIGVLLLLMALFAAVFKGSCPFVYVIDPKTGKRRLWGEAYSGAVVKSLARRDRMALPEHDGDVLQLVLSNEAPETQYTDAAWVEVVEHGEDERVVATFDAELVRVGPSTAPEQVEDLAGRDQTLVLRDGLWASDLHEALRADPRPTTEGLVARFAEAPESAAVELVLRNSPWLDRVSMLAWASLGDELVEQVQTRGAKPIAAGRAEAMMREGGVYARVELRQGGAWKHVADLPPVGWVGDRRLVVPLDKAVPGAPIEVRLSGGIGFLLVREMALTSIRGQAEPAVVAPHKAVQSTGEDELARLASVDGDPNVLEALHESVALDFALPPRSQGRARSLFLHTHGYYEVHPPDDLIVPPEAAAALRRPSSFGEASLLLFEVEFAGLADAEAGQ
ncbi:MAG: hypothetical protein EP330_23260 [Deltaproteobacteria bacterium]|nr:MAG: hypothetical protein EP330_23260 [Deltaproteobacteria bacterium]